MSAQRGWLAWWDGSLPPEVAYRRSLEPSDYPDVAAARALSTEIDDKTSAFADRLTEAEAQRVYSFPTPNGPVLELPLWKMMLHVANHGTQHRSEVAAMLTAFGSSPGSLDQLGFFLSGGGAPQ